MRQNRYLFVVDTEQYAGNFERWLCGYMTGRTDEPVTHGDEEAAIAKNELPSKMWDYFQEHVLVCSEKPDDCPIDTPVIIYPTPGWFNHGMGGHFKEGEEAKALKDHDKEVEKYEKDHKCNLGIKKKKLTKFPAYQSVAIFFDEKPPKDVIATLKERAYKFAKEYWPNHEVFASKITVTGFRLLHETTKTTVKAI